MAVKKKTVCKPKAKVALSASTQAFIEGGNPNTPFRRHLAEDTKKRQEDDRTSMEKNLANMREQLNQTLASMTAEADRARAEATALHYAEMRTMATSLMGVCADMAKALAK